MRKWSDVVRKKKKKGNIDGWFDLMGGFYI